MSGNGNRIIFKSELFISGLVPFHCVDLLEGIDLVCSDAVIDPLIVCGSPECDNRFLVFVADKDCGNSAASAVSLIAVC